MTAEILLHIDEDLTEAETTEFLKYFGNSPNGLQAHLHSSKKHLLFVAYDNEELCPHDLIAMSKEAGVHAHLVDF